MDYKLEMEVTGVLKTNTYLLYDVKTKEAALFDVGGKIKDLLQIIKNEQLKIKYIFCTHLHFDHIQGVEKIRELFPDAKFAFNEKELTILENSGPFAKMFGFKFHSIGECDIFIKDNESFTLGTIELKTILAPGHTPGSICFHFDDILISGDVLFYRGVGRTDLFGGSYETLLNSLKELFKLPESTKVYPGHGEFTTIGEEKEENPFFSINDI